MTVITFQGVTRYMSEHLAQTILLALSPCSLLPSQVMLLLLIIHIQWRSQPKSLGGAKIFGWAKMFDLRRITLFCLEKRLSKHNIAIFSKNLGRAWPRWPSLAMPMPTYPAKAFAQTLL